MSWLNKLKDLVSSATGPRITVEDPILGIVTYDRINKLWECHVFFEPLKENTSVLVPGENPPTEMHRRSFKTLVDRYPAVKPAIDKILRQQYFPDKQELENMQSMALDEEVEYYQERMRTFDTPEKFSALLQLDCIEIVDGDSYRLSYGFRDDQCEPTTSLHIGLRDWIPNPEGLSD